jgi:hypothetical protein
VVEAAMAAVVRAGQDRFGLTRPPLYSRVDLVTLDDGQAAVLEVELAEPSFFLWVDPGRRTGSPPPPSAGCMQEGPG